MAARTTRLAGIGVFRDLPPEASRELEDRLLPVPVRRGETLVRQGEEADALYLVVTGRFEVLLDGGAEPVAEIGAGSPIGEIAFFAGGRRTATVRALRDSVVLKLGREEFEDLARRSPGVWAAITATLAQRLAATTAASSHQPIRTSRPHTICVLRAGAGSVPEEFQKQLEAAFASSRTLFLDAGGVTGEAGRSASRPPGDDDDTQWFNDLESRFETVVYVADANLTPWSQKAIRQADVVVAVAQARQPMANRQVNEVEAFAAPLHKPRNIRLVLLHETAPPFSGTRHWLAPRPWLHAHHHVRLSRAGDTARLVRFLNGTAMGLVACGGGAFSSAHIGMYQALCEGGLEFDIMGGTSGGAAMTAAFVRGVGPDEIERAVHEIFVRRRAMRRWTWPRYSLLDPSVLDACLEEHFTSLDIEDLPLPYFAVATNLTRNEPVCIRSGPLWQAVRASSAIPALLPPVISRDGDMLVDGCLLENVPVETMHAIKSGPNVVIDFQVPALDRCQDPMPALSRIEIFRRSLTRSLRRGLPPGPSPQMVLMRSLMLNNQGLKGRLRPGDLLLEPAIPEGISHLDWHRHADLRAEAYAYGLAELERVGRLQRG